MATELEIDKFWHVSQTSNLAITAHIHACASDGNAWAKTSDMPASVREWSCLLRDVVQVPRGDKTCTRPKRLGKPVRARRKCRHGTRHIRDVVPRPTTTRRTNSRRHHVQEVPRVALRDVPLRKYRLPLTDNEGTNRIRIRGRVVHGVVDHIQGEAFPLWPERPLR